MIRGHKKSSIEWEETIPVDWDEVRAKFLFKNIKEIVGDKWDEYQRISLTYDGVIPRSKTDKEGLNPASLGTYQIVKENDLLFKLIDLENEKTSRVGLSSYEGITSSAYVRVDIQKQFPKYYYYWYYSMWFRYIYNKLGNGVRSTINASQLLNYSVPKPSYKEQQEIAHFLDKNVEKINELIQIQEDAIVKFEEYKQSVISKIVTSSINHGVKTKLSPVKWLQKIPHHWKVICLRYSGKLYGGLKGKSGSDFNNPTNVFNQSFIPFTNIVNNDVIQVNEFQKVNVLPNEQQNEVKQNDLLFLMSSENYDDLGKSAIILDEIEDLYLNSFCKGYRIKSKNIYPKYLNYAVNSTYLRQVISLGGNGYTRINLRQNHLKDTKVPLPPYNEQFEAVKYLDELTKITNKLIQIKKDKIEKLNEYKKSLIYEAVTGKIEVM